MDAVAKVNNGAMSTTYTSTFFPHKFIIILNSVFFQLQHQNYSTTKPDTKLHIANMHYYASLVFIATASLAKAAKLGNTDFTSISAGILFTITWLDASGPVTLKLKNGPA